MTLSTPNRDWLQLPVSVDKTSGQAKVEISADMAMQLALESNLGSNFEKSELIQRKDETYRRVDQAQFKVCGQTVYFGLFESGVWEEIGNEPSRYEIDGQAELFKIPKDRNQGNIYFLANNNLFKVAFCKFKGDLYLQDMWGMWDRVDKEEISDLSDRAEELTDSLGFSTYCLVKELPDTASNKLPGTISRRRHSLYVELPSQSTVSLSPTSTPLIYTYTLEIEGELVTTPVCIWENEHGQLALYPDDYARLCAHVEQADAAEQQEGQNDNSMGFD